MDYNNKLQTLHPENHKEKPDLNCFYYMVAKGCHNSK